MPRTAPRKGPLDGVTVVVTRPSASAASLIAAVRAHGGSPLRLPGIALRAADDRERVRAALLGARGADTIWSSPQAVRFAFAIAPDFAPSRRARAFAIGSGTARALARRGIGATMPPDRFDSEGVLALASLRDVRGRRVAIVGAPGGRGLIASTLKRRGARVETIEVYRRVPPRWTRRHLEALARAHAPLATLVTSADALAHLVERLPASPLARLRQATLVVGSRRLADAARRAGFRRIRIAASATGRDLIECLAADRARRA